MSFWLLLVVLLLFVVPVFPPPGKGGTHMKGQNIRVCPVVMTPFFKLSCRSSDPQLHFPPVLKTRFLKFLIFNQKKLQIFRISLLQKPIFAPISALYLKNFFQNAALYSLFLPKIRSLDPRFDARRTPPPTSKSSAPGRGPTTQKWG